MLASICKTSHRPHISDAGGNQKGSEYIPNFEIVSRPENMESQQASRATSEEDVKWKFDTKASPPKSNLSKKKRVARQKHHKAMPSGVNKKNTAKTTRAGKKPKQQKNSQSRGAKVSSAKDNLLPPPRECHVINLEKQLDMFGTSSDERENRNFVEHMKQMAEEKICVSDQPSYCSVVGCRHLIDWSDI